MKQALATALLLVSASIAHAQPSLTTGSDREAPRSYVSLGTTIGADAALDWLYSGAAIDGGYQLSTTWWLHGEVGVLGRTGYGPINRSITLMSPSSDAYEARLGPEARHCFNGALCAVGGVDLGYRTGELRGIVVAPRLGLDIGGSHLRFRPGVELAVGGPVSTSEGPSLPDVGIGMTAAVAYQW